MFCPKCGAQLEAGAKFCTGCGTAMDGSAQPAAAPPPPQAPMQQAAAPPQQPYQAPGGAAYPGAPGGAAGMQKPTNYLPWAIGATICCCVPGGIVGIVYSVQANSKWDAGDYAGSQQAADSARKWLIASAVLGFIFSLIYGGISFMGAMSQM